MVVHICERWLSFINPSTALPLLTSTPSVERLPTSRSSTWFQTRLHWHPKKCLERKMGVHLNHRNRGPLCHRTYETIAASRCFKYNLHGSWILCCLVAVVPLCFSLLVSFLKKLTPPRHYDTYRHTPCDTICVTSLTWEPKNSAFRNRNNTPETSAASKSQAPSLQTSGRAPRLRTTEKCSHRCPQATWEPVPESESLCAIEHKTD